MTVQDRTVERSIPDLLADLSRDSSTLVRKEVELLRTETSEKVTQSMVALGSIAGGAILALGALIVLLQAVVIALTELGIPPGWSALIVGVVVAGVAYAMVQKGMSDLKASNLAPSRTIDSLKRDAEVAREKV